MSMGETCGSSLCYLLSSAIAKPVLEYLVPAKLISLRKRAEEEHDNMLLFNIFLRLSPAPTWLVNLASPAMGNPLPSFFFGTLFGTFFPTLLLTPELAKCSALSVRKALTCHRSRRKIFRTSSSSEALRLYQSSSFATRT